MPKFKIGDRVVVNNPHGIGCMAGRITDIEGGPLQFCYGIDNSFPMYGANELSLVVEMPEFSIKGSIIEPGHPLWKPDMCHLCNGSGKRVMFNKSVECDCLINGRITLVEENDPINWG